jgi:Tfp pilus assembly protein PilF
LQALYHIYGRDFLTPAGIPILPAGSEDMYSFLTADLGLSPVAAADVLSINAVELLGGILSVFAVIRLAAVARRMLEDRRIAKRVERATTALERKDFLTASQALREACSAKPRDTGLTLLLAATYHRSGNTLQAHFEYRNVVEWGSGDEPSVEVGGAAISLRGIAATGALATSDALAKSPDHRDAWRKHVVELGRAGISAFESVANDNVDRRFVKALGEGSLLPPQLLSAAVNSYMAGQLAGAAMLLPEREEALQRAARTCDEHLIAVQARRSVQDRVSDLGFMRRLVQSELLPLPVRPS